VTRESIIYGITRGMQFAGSLLWFYCYSRLMTGDKFAHLFGRVFPSGTLVFSMVLGFVPRFSKRLARIGEAQRSLAPPSVSGSLRDSAARGVRILSAMTTWSLENAVDTSDSMRSRGYGLPGRSRYMPYAWSRRDFWTSLLLALAAGGVILGAALGAARFVPYPILDLAPLSGAGAITLLGYGALCFAPLLLNLTEVLKWTRIRSAA
jgi:energy-coupling factor transport system permease protein